LPRNSGQILHSPAQSSAGTIQHKEPPITVRRRLTLSLSTLIACCALLGASALVGLWLGSRHFATADDQYRQLRSLYEIGFRCASARSALNAPAPDIDAIRRNLIAASQEADNLASRPDASDSLRTVRASIQSRLRDIAEPSALVASLSAATQAQIIDNRTRASDDYRVVLRVILVVFCATLLLAVAVGLLQLRSIAKPLRALDAATGHLTQSRLDHRIDETGDREFRRLIRHFNRMSTAIQQLHDSMRRQVDMKSRQLLRSEQLAAVGTLAAGLAHAQTPADLAAASAKARDTLRIVCEEAFRCRDIAAQLLNLARPSDEHPEPVSLESLTRRAIDLIRRLPVARAREIVFRCNGRGDDSLCLGHPAQLLQVLLNLLTNALEACEPGAGRIVLTLDRRADTVMLSVTDNGCGMSPDALTLAFDPFFTDKPRRGLSGAGLGLSVSHAIVERHRGRLYAHSDGPGRGSVFILELIAAPVRSNDPLATEPADAH